MLDLSVETFKQVVSLGIGVAMFHRMAMFLLLLFMPITLAEKDIILEITDASSSEVQLSCHYNYDGDMTSVTFSVFKGPSACLERSGDSSANHNCGFEFLESEDPKTFPFAVTLDGSCNQTMDLKCRISNTIAGSVIEYKDYITLTAQSDPPIISVNNGKTVEASSEPIQITCQMTNVCYETKLDIFGEVPRAVVSTRHTRQGSRFNTTAITHAIFSEPGNYTITCEEVGKENSRSGSHNVEVLPSHEASDQQNVTKGSENCEVSTILLIAGSSLLAFNLALGVIYLKKWMWSKKKIKLPKNSVPGSHEHGESRDGESHRYTLVDIKEDQRKSCACSLMGRQDTIIQNVE